MRLIKRLINKLQMFKKQNIKKEEIFVEKNIVDVKKATTEQETKQIMQDSDWKRDRENPLKFQDDINHDLWLRGTGG